MRVISQGRHGTLMHGWVYANTLAGNYQEFDLRQG
jgi:hypothetical protein